MIPMRLQVMRVGEVVVELPKYATECASGVDLRAAIGGIKCVTPGMCVKIDTGIAVAIPVGYEGQIRPRSSMSMRGIHCALGTIDADYRGPLAVVVWNLSDTAYDVHPGDRIAQLVIAPVQRVELELVDKLDDTKRGANGFGSSGRNEWNT